MHRRESDLIRSILGRPSVSEEVLQKFGDRPFFKENPKALELVSEFYPVVSAVLDSGKPLSEILPKLAELALPEYKSQMDVLLSAAGQREMQKILAYFYEDNIEPLMNKDELGAAAKTVLTPLRALDTADITAMIHDAIAPRIKIRYGQPETASDGDGLSIGLATFSELKNALDLSEEDNAFLAKVGKAALSSIKRHFNIRGSGFGKSLAKIMAIEAKAEQARKDIAQQGIALTDAERDAFKHVFLSHFPLMLAKVVKATLDQNSNDELVARALRAGQTLSPASMMLALGSLPMLGQTLLEGIANKDTKLVKSAWDLAVGHVALPVNTILDAVNIIPAKARKAFMKDLQKMGTELEAAGKAVLDARKASPAPRPTL